MQQDKFLKHYSVLSHWRDVAYSVNKSRDPYAGILPFVSGLRFSSMIIHIISEIIKYSNLSVTWGHIYEKNDHIISYSNECDIIIYKEEFGCEKHHWDNEYRNPKQESVMSFKFIDKKFVVGVISCKSHIVKSQIDKEYPQLLRPFTKNVWLFSECCNPKSLIEIRKQAKKLKYKNFWSLYTWSPKEGPKENFDDWENFESSIEHLANKHKNAIKKILT